MRLWDFTEISHKIDRASPVPLYHQLKQLIMEEITSGRLRAGTSLPSEMEICSTLNFSRPTVRQALNAMVADGYLVRKKGKGTFVSRPKLEANFIQKLESFHEEMLRQGMTPITEVLRLEIIPGIPARNEKLSIPEGERLVLLERLCRGDGEPFMYQESYLPASRFAALVNEDLTSHSLYSLLHAHFGTEVVHVHRQIEAVDASQADADLLNIARGQAICLVHNTAYDQYGVPVEYNISRYRGDRNKFTMDMHAIRQPDQAYQAL